MASIKDINDISAEHVAALAEVGVHTTSQLLEAGATSAGRMRLADEAHLTDEMVKKWVHQADLLRIDGMDSQLAALLCAVDVCTVPKLAYRVGDSLYDDLVTLGKRTQGASNVPTIAALEAYISQAKKLPKIVHH